MRQHARGGRTSRHGSIAGRRGFARRAPPSPASIALRAIPAVARRLAVSGSLALVAAAPVRAQAGAVDSARAVTTAAANLRAAPSTGSAIVARLGADSPVHVDGCYGDWCAVRDGETLGYVFRDLIRVRLVGESDRTGCPCVETTDDMAPAFRRTSDNRSPSGTGQEGHSGFHAAIGIAYGQATPRCQYCGNDARPSYAPMVRLGYAVTPRLVLSGEVQSWSGDRAEMAWINVVAQYYPGNDYQFFLKGGGGLGAVRVVTFFGAAFQASNAGFVAGLGYDMRLSRGFSVTAYADYLNSDGGMAQAIPGGPSIKLGADATHAGLSASWR